MSERVTERYRKILTSMWKDAKIRRLSTPQPNGQTLWVSLLSGEFTSLIPGLLNVGRAAYAESLGWSQEAFEEAFQEVFQEGLVEADWGARLIWVRNALRHNLPASPNVIDRWRCQWVELPECELLDRARDAMMETLQEHGPSYAEAFRRMLAGEDHPLKGKPSRKGKGKPSTESSSKPSTDPSRNQDQDQDQDQDQEGGLRPPAGSHPASVTLKGNEAIEALEQDSPNYWQPPEDSPNERMSHRVAKIRFATPDDIALECGRCHREYSTIIKSLKVNPQPLTYSACMDTFLAVCLVFRDRGNLAGASEWVKKLWLWGKDERNAKHATWANGRDHYRSPPMWLGKPDRVEVQMSEFDELMAKFPYFMEVV